MTQDRRSFLRFTAAALGGATLGVFAAPSLRAQGAQGQLPTMTVYKSPSCGCCSQWVDHVKDAGFTVREVNTDNLNAVKTEMGVPARLASCHTAVVGGVLVEGHVPAADVKRLLRDKPTGVRGIAVPGMPIGSPGMEQGPPSRYERYQVLAFTASGEFSVFATHGPPTRE